MLLPKTTRHWGFYAVPSSEVVTNFFLSPLQELGAETNLEKYGQTVRVSRVLKPPKDRKA